MKNFRQLVREARVEDEGLPSGAAMTLKDKPNKEPMHKLKEQDDTTEKEEMAQTQLHFIKYASEEIIEFIEMGGEIEEWYQNKLSKVHSDMEGLHSYIEGEKRRTGMVKEEALSEKITVVPAGTPNTGIRKIKLPGGGTITAGTHAIRPNKPKPSFLDQIRAKKNYTREEYESLPASKSLQKAHDDERKKRGLPDPDYYLKLRDQKKKEIEDMKKEEVEQIDEKNVPTSPEKWAQAKAQAKAKFDVYPSAYANGWASKKYKEMGGGWKSVSEESELEEGYGNHPSQRVDPRTGKKYVPPKSPLGQGVAERQETERLKPPFTPDKPKKQAVAGKYGSGYSTARHLARQAMKKYTKPVKESLEESRRSEIIKEIVKKKKNEEKFNAEPIISDTVTRNN
jgi:hypothetical protein